MEASFREPDDTAAPAEPYAPPPELLDHPHAGQLTGDTRSLPEQVDFVTLSHFDHAGGTSRFPKAKFIVQRRELEYAAGALPHNSAAKGAFVADDVLAVVQLNWRGRVLLADGDVEGIVPGVDVYLTPGHAVGTMTVCLDTIRGHVCYSSDASTRIATSTRTSRSAWRSTPVKRSSPTGRSGGS